MFLKNRQFIAQSGPSYESLPPFQWSKADFDKECPHEGHPDLFQFKPLVYDGSVKPLVYDGSVKPLIYDNRVNVQYIP